MLKMPKEPLFKTETEGLDVPFYPVSEETIETVRRGADTADTDAPP